MGDAVGDASQHPTHALHPSVPDNDDSGAYSLGLFDERVRRPAPRGG